MGGLNDDVIWRGCDGVVSDVLNARISIWLQHNLLDKTGDDMLDLRPRGTGVEPSDSIDDGWEVSGGDTFMHVLKSIMMQYIYINESYDACMMFILMHTPYM